MPIHVTASPVENAMIVRIKRIYEPAAKSDGVRILVDRIWPQNISRFDAKIDLWQRDVAPTTELRRWFGHKPERWKEFQRRYRAELKTNPALAELRGMCRQKPITLLYAARNTDNNHALVLQSVLSRVSRRGRTAPSEMSSPALQKASGPSPHPP